MGLLTRFVRKGFYHGLSILTCSNVAKEEGEEDSNGAPPQQLTHQKSGVAEDGSLSRWIQIFSTLFDLLDLMNAVMDLIFAIRLFQLPDSIVYACILLIGLILGRLVVFRATTVMFRGGLDWSPFWIDVKDYPMSRKNRQAFATLYCLLFSETAVFLYEDYPSLVTYAHWPVINFPPAPLDAFDNYNIAIAAASLAILMLLFLIAIGASLWLMQWKKWNRKTQCINALKILLFLAACGFLSRFVIDILVGAVQFAFQDKRQVPSNKVMGIALCDSETMETRYELCDERIFMVRVAIAWFTASVFFLHLLFKPATFPVESDRRSKARSKFINQSIAVSNGGDNDDKDEDDNNIRDIADEG